VRVIAATNRNLQAEVNDGRFRMDLYYRLNVFPIHVPSLRERGDDIPILIDYFVSRFANRMGKRIRQIERRTAEMLERYPWPGNIRELQNVIERAVIVADTEVLSIDESWLSRQSISAATGMGRIPKVPPDREQKIIEAALAESRGRVSGPSGAATKLGVPSTTLESRIRSLKINKHRFRSLDD
jgi:DNA-binding NtrC family response regulator